MSNIHENNFSTTLTQAVSDVGTTINIASSTGFPTIPTGSYVWLTLRSGSSYEIVKATARSSLAVTVVRSQQSTTGVQWAAGTLVSITVTRDSIDGKMERGDGTTLTIASGSVTALSAYHLVDTESSGATDDLDTIDGTAFVTGQILIVRAANSSRTVVLKDGTGNLKLSGDLSLDNTEDTATLVWHSPNWYLLCFSNNGA